MRAASKRRGVAITSISRPIRPSDFRDFDIILAMDKQNRGTQNMSPPPPPPHLLASLILLMIRCYV